MSDAIAAGIRDAVAALARADRTYTRFGAAHHRYELAPAAPIAPLEAALGVALPDDVRGFVSAIASGGAGPGYGWLPITRTVDHLVTAPTGTEGWSRALPLAHLGCGYAAVLALDGAARGEVWIDARAVGVVARIGSSFTAYYLDWIDRLDRAIWPDAHVPAGACALAIALSGYLGVCEQRRGLAPGELAGTALREALTELGPGAIEIAAEAPNPLFEAGARVDPCISCARMLAALVDDGLGRDVVVPGTLPLSLRSA